MWQTEGLFTSPFPLCSRAGFSASTREGWLALQLGHLDWERNGGGVQLLELRFMVTSDHVTGYSNRTGSKIELSATARALED